MPLLWTKYPHIFQLSTIPPKTESNYPHSGKNTIFAEVWLIQGRSTILAKKWISRIIFQQSHTIFPQIVFIIAAVSWDNSCRSSYFQLFHIVSLNTVICSTSLSPSLLLPAQLISSCQQRSLSAGLYNSHQHGYVHIQCLHISNFFSYYALLHNQNTTALLQRCSVVKWYTVLITIAASICTTYMFSYHCC